MPQHDTALDRGFTTQFLNLRMLELPYLQRYFWPTGINDGNLIDVACFGERTVEWGKEVVAALPMLTVKMRKKFILSRDKVDVVSSVSTFLLCRV